MLHTLATIDPHPGSVPINVLSKVPGTPLAEQPDVPIWDTVRMIATARILMPRIGRAPVGGAGEDVGQRSGAVLHGRREFDLLQREQSDADQGRAVAGLR